MPFTIDEDVGGSNSISVSYPALTTVMTAGEAVPVGGVAVLRTDGKVYWAMEQRLPGSNLRPITNPVAVYNGLQSPVRLHATNRQKFIAGARLSNGNFVMVTVGAEPPYNVAFWIVDGHGGGVFPVTIVGQAYMGGGGGLAHIVVTALVGGGFAVAWNGNGLPFFAIYSSSGALVKSATQIGPAGSMTHLSIASLQNGSFVILYNPTFGVPAAFVCSGTGTDLRAAIVSAIGTDNNMTQQPNVAGLKGGGFVVVYAISNGTTNTNYFRRFDNAAVPVGAEVVLRAGAALANASIAVAAFDTGGFFIVESDGVRGSVWGDDGVQVGPITMQQPGLNAPSMAVASHGNHGLCAWRVHNGPLPASSSIKAVPFYPSGPGPSQPTFATNASNGGSLTAVCSSLIAGLNAILYEDANSKPAIVTFGIDYVLWAATSIPAIEYTGGQGVICSVEGKIKNQYPNFLFVTVNNGGFVHLAVCNALVPACRPIGVFAASAVADAPVPVQWRGVATLATPFSQPYYLPPNPLIQLWGNWTFIGNSLVMEAT